MNIWKALAALQSAGTLLSVIGKFVQRLGEAITVPNLGTGTPPPSSEEDERTITEGPCPPGTSELASGDSTTSQDPPPLGGMDEKPDEGQTSFLFIGGGTTVPPLKE